MILAGTSASAAALINSQAELKKLYKVKRDYMRRVERCLDQGD